MNIRLMTIVAILTAILTASLTGAAHAQPLDRELLDLAGKLQERRRARFDAVKTPAELEVLQKDLREKFLRLLDGFPDVKGVPPARITGIIEAEDYVVEKLVFESLPGYFVTAVLYRPKKVDRPLPGIIGPCGHAAIGKAYLTYQTLHINLVKRGYVVLAYDPVGEGERSQYWDVAANKSRYNLQCGEHAVLGTPLYLLGTSLARWRIWDGMRALDYLASRPEVDAKRLGSVGNSGGGNLTAYISALDPRVKAAAIGCYITALPRRMANRIQEDPDLDPEQDIFGFVGDGIDHAGLLALRVPRPTLLATAQLDFFPIEGARETFLEAKKLFKVAGAEDALRMTEAPLKHGLNLPLRESIYVFFARWLAGRTEPGLTEIKVKIRTPEELRASPDGQVNVSLKSRHLLPMALEEFDRRPKSPRKSLAEVLRLDPEQARYELHPLADSGNKGKLVILVNGNETRGWEEEKAFVKSLQEDGYDVAIIDPRGVGKLRPVINIRGNRSYTDPLESIEGNLAANAFLCGKSLAGMRVTDVQAAVRSLTDKMKPSRVVLCGRRDAAMIVCLTAAIEPAITHVAAEELPLTMRWYFDPIGRPLNGAVVVPGLLRDFGDIKDVFAAIAPRKALVSAGLGTIDEPLPGVERIERAYSTEPELLRKWLCR